MNTFVILTHVISDYTGELVKLPGLRLQVRHIVGYMPNASGGAVVQTSDHESYRVAESVERIDQAISDVSDNFTGLRS